MSRQDRYPISGMRFGFPQLPARNTVLTGIKLWLTWPTMETTVLKAKNNLSLLLRKAEEGEEVVIRRGVRGTSFRIVRVEEPVRRTLAPDPRWKDRIAFKDEGVWESEWKEEE